MKVLLISAPQGTAMQPVVPLGMLYIAAALEKENHSVEFLDLGFSRNLLRDIKWAITRFLPEVIGISIRNIAETDHLKNLYKEYRDIVQEAKKNAIVVLGGAGFSIFPEELLTYTGAHYGIEGEGEGQFVRLLEEIQKKPPGKGLIQFLYKTKEYHHFKRQEVDLTKVRQHHWQKYGKYYSLASSPIPIQTSRGCSLGCNYCAYPRIQGSHVRLRSPEAVVAEFKMVSDMPGVKSIFITDSAMNLDDQHIKKILALLIKTKNRSKLANWYGCLSPLHIDDELVYLLSRSGCIQCELGIDSFSNGVLDKLCKGFNATQALKSAKVLQKAKIPYSISLILGGPGETAATLKETLSIIKEIRPKYVHAFIGVRLYPNTRLLKEIKAPSEGLLWPHRDAFYVSNDAVEVLKKVVQNPPEGWYFSNTTILENKGVN